jgi:hypothetical protein
MMEQHDSSRGVGVWETPIIYLPWLSCYYLGLTFSLLLEQFRFRDLVYSSELLSINPIILGNSSFILKVRFSYILLATLKSQLPVLPA